MEHMEIRMMEDKKELATGTGPTIMVLTAKQPVVPLKYFAT